MLASLHMPVCVPDPAHPHLHLFFSSKAEGWDNISLLYGTIKFSGVILFTFCCDINLNIFPRRSHFLY